jgi:hypothetical protein
MRRHLAVAKFSVHGAKNFSILHSEESAVRQIKVGSSKLALMRHGEMRAGMEKYLADLE